MASASVSVSCSCLEFLPCLFLMMVYNPKAEINPFLLVFLVMVSIAATGSERDKRSSVVSAVHRLLQRHKQSFNDVLYNYDCVLYLSLLLEKRVVLSIIRQFRKFHHFKSFTLLYILLLVKHCP